MSITANDLKFFAAAIMSDADNAGGRRSSTIVQNGVLNNVFSPVTTSERLGGKVSIRKVYPSVTSADRSVLLTAGVYFNELPTDPAVSTFMWRYGDSTATRKQALAWIKSGVASIAGNAVYNPTGGTATAGSATITGLSFSDSALFDGVSATNWFLISPALFLTFPGDGLVYVLTGSRYALRRVVSRSGSSVTVDKPMPFSGPANFGMITSFPNSFQPQRIYGANTLSADAVVDDTSVYVNSPFVQVAGLVDGGSLPGTTDGFGPLIVNSNLGNVVVNYANSAGFAPFVLPGDIVTLSDEKLTTAATASNSGTVSTRTNIDQVAVIGNNGVEIIRLVKDGPTISGASASVDFATGELTFIDVTGYSQPVRVAHRRIHECAVTDVVLNRIGLSAALPTDFDSGALVSTRQPLGDIQAIASTIFAQQAWSSVWSDTVIGKPVSLPYSAEPALTNQGAETDRWAIVATNGNTFDCYSERLGKIASGNTATNFSPTNPVTGAPFFTLLSANWSVSLLVGSAFRFNTTAATSAASLWVARATKPSTPSGSDRVVLRMIGDV